MHAWLRSPLARLTWQVPLLVVFILSLVLIPTYNDAVNDIKAEVRSAINEEILGLFEVYREQGVPGLAAAVERRNRISLDESAVYLLTNAKGVRIAGDDIEWPRVVPLRNDRWFDVTDPEGDTLVGKIFILQDNVRLLVAQRSPLKKFRSDLRSRLTLAGMLAFLGSLLLGAWTLGRYRQRLTRIQTTARTILSGNLAQRLQLDGQQDELDELASEFNQAFAEIEKLMDATRHVSSAIAHDMRRPISAIRYRLEELLRRTDLPDDVHEQVALLLEQTDESLNAFAALLRLARLESGSYGPKREPVDLPALLAEVVETYEPVAAANHMQLTADYGAASDSQLLGDWNLLFQGLQNLLDNAIHYGRERIDINLQRQHDHAIITVRDYGPGVEDTALPRLFERFYRADSARTTGGSGIGLALVRAIADIHGGQVSASNAHPGFMVTIDLPLSTIEASEQ
jgi:signal transduction histidine kinase